MVRLVAPVAALLLAACPQVNDAPDQGIQASATPSSIVPGEGPPTYAISDVQLVRRDDPVADVVWAVAFDAEWRGEGPPERIKCRWRLLDEDELPIVAGAVYVEDSVDDHLTPEVYPDEIPGVPQGASVVCP